MTLVSPKIIWMLSWWDFVFLRQRLCSLSCPGTHRDPLAPASHVFTLKVCATMPRTVLVTFNCQLELSGKRMSVEEWPRQDQNMGMSTRDCFDSQYKKAQPSAVASFLWQLDFNCIWKRADGKPGCKRAVAASMFLSHFDCEATSWVRGNAVWNGKQVCLQVPDLIPLMMDCDLKL